MEKKKETKSIKSKDIKEEIIEKIKTLGGSDIGISYEVLKKEFNLKDEMLKKFLNDLQIESRIFQPEENFYQLILKSQ